MKYIGEKAIKKLISLIKRDLNKKLDKNQGTTNSGKILGVNASGEVAPTDTEIATLVDVPNGLLKGDGTTISQAVEGTDYVVPSTALNELPGHIANGDIHVTAEQKTAWNGKQPKIMANGLLKGDGNGGVSAAAAGTDYAAASHNHDSSYLKLSGGKLTGNLSGKYITGTWLQTTEATALGSATTKICVLDGSGWVYYRTLADFKDDLSLNIAFTVTLPASGWNNKAQTISNAKFVASGYAYTVSPEGGSFLACNAAIIYVDNVTEAGKMTFHCVETPTEDLTMNILRTEVST